MKGGKEMKKKRASGAFIWRWSWLHVNSLRGYGAIMTESKWESKIGGCITTPDMTD